VLSVVSSLLLFDFQPSTFDFGCLLSTVDCRLLAASSPCYFLRSKPSKYFTSEIPPVMGSKMICLTMEVRARVRSRAWLAVSCAVKTSRAEYLAKSTPHCSHWPPCACTCLQAGQV